MTCKSNEKEYIILSPNDKFFDFSIRVNAQDEDDAEEKARERNGRYMCHAISVEDFPRFRSLVNSVKLK